MPYSVWQDGRLKGMLAVRFQSHDDSKSVGGIFIPAPDYTDIVPIIQTVCEILPHKPTLHGAVPPESDSSEEGKPMLLMSEEEAQGVPPQKILELRDDNGDVVPTNFLMLETFEVPDGQGEYADACRELGVVNEGWLLSASLVSEKTVGLDVFWSFVVSRERRWPTSEIAVI